MKDRNVTPWYNDRILQGNKKTTETPTPEKLKIGEVKRSIEEIRDKMEEDRMSREVWE